MTRVHIYLLIICSLLIASVMGYKDYSYRNKVYFVIEMEASTSGTGQIFFDSGRGYSEQDSSRIQIQRGAFRKYYFPLPAVTINSIRFDPIDRTSVINIKKARIENSMGETLRIFPVQSFRSTWQINRMDVNGDVLSIHTAKNANDPQTIIENSSFVSGKSSWINFLAQRIWIYSGYALLSFTIFIGLAKRRQQISKTLEWLVNYLVENPKKAITFIGIISAVVSCYPVIFFGKTIVHAIGLGALYDGSPWIPGFLFDGAIENFRSSDVGATAWNFAPNSVVQYDSLFRYFEFPFWNRYVGAGVPLFAQGHSMIGDPLHWIPVFLGGSSIGWDLKYILAKMIFAAGMGLLIFRLTDKLLAGLLIAISSCFIGFFAFKFNHPAYFVLTYAPWVVLQWDRLGRVFALPNPRARSCVFQGLLLAIVTWLQLNAGPPKEGVITACFIQAFGILLFCTHVIPKWGRIRCVIFVCGVGLSLILITAPHWLLFLDALSKSATDYDIPGANPYPPWAIVAFFDNYFFQKIYDAIAGPSLNLFALFCVSSSLYNLRNRQSSMVYVSWGLFSLAMFTAYGLIPVSIIIAIPFINKIQHVGNTFSVPMLILGLIIAGYGIRDYLMASEKLKSSIIIFSLLCFWGLWLLFDYGGSTTISYGSSMQISIVERYFLVIFIILICFLQLYLRTKSGVWKKKKLLIVLTGIFLMLHVRHGLHLRSGVEAIDAYVTNPTGRVNFAIKSDAIEFIKNKINEANMPMRVIGEGVVLYPGFNARYGLEGLVSVEALRNKNYENLLSIIDYPAQGGWLRLIKSDQIASRAAALDLLGVGYIAATPETQMPPGMKLIHSSDLDIWERETVWPRAFFVNQVVEVYKPADILDALAKVPRAPFAAVESQFIPEEMPKNINAISQVVPAQQYLLTNNSTKFSVDATGPGLIVLGETYYPEDFVASVNGERVDYVRVNEAFKGIWVRKAGRYDVNFTYRPAKLDQAMIMSVCGMLLLFILSVASFKKGLINRRFHGAESG